MYCTKCGNKIDDNAKFCPKCGNAVQTNNTTNSMDDSLKKAKEFAKEKLEKANDLASKTLSSENVQKVANKLEETAQNVSNSEIAKDVQKNAEKLKKNVINEWNTTDDKKTDNTNLKFYQKTWFIVLMMVVFFPVGLFLMWKYKKFGSGKVRIIVTVCVCIVGIYAYADTFNDSSNLPSGDYYTVDPETGKKHDLNSGEELNDSYNVWGDKVDSSSNGNYTIQEGSAASMLSESEFSEHFANDVKSIIKNHDDIDDKVDWKGSIDIDDADGKLACGLYNYSTYTDITYEALLKLEELCKQDGKWKVSTYFDKENLIPIILYKEK